ncbi:MAG TPA: NADPH-dependent glutamate synthase [Methanocella sp.]|uniref:NADPH-dependent glutamate synthase n=1 Tax=Methanocella sp. TaxID=2052833 RepID=UPI002C07EA1A|nr:NADPH-dependent glutamate synthase [Methanocella sp.]HTY90693.1 NADPH-dependent glutamate synthase [Methanocella sp.]
MPKLPPTNIDRRRRTPMQEQAPAARAKNFAEVALGYTGEEAMKEAKRCLQCDAPMCKEGCPVGIDIPKFVRETAEGRFEEAARTLKESNNLPAICGRVCPQESQCEKKCILGMKWSPLAIGRLERFIADNEKAAAKADIKPNGRKVAVIGSGPAGLTAAADLARMGYGVTIFEALHKPGGVLTYGIPEFRLPKEIVKKEVDYVRSLGVEIRLNSIIGKTITIDEIFARGYEAVFVGSGAGLPTFMHIPGENLNGVYSANEFLTRVNLMKAFLFPEYDTPIQRGRSVAVVGGGNVAMDAARTAKRMGAEHVYLIYRRGEDEMPARREELEHAREEGIEFKLLMNPTKVMGDNQRNVRAIELICMELGEPDASGRRSPVCREGSETTLDVDTVIIAIGTSPNPLIVKTTPGLKTGKHGVIEVEPYTFKTSREGVFAGGDIVSGAATVISAMGQAKEAAKAIDEYLKNKV